MPATDVSITTLWCVFKLGSGCRQVPTFRADPLTPSCDTWCEFPVSDRPNAVAQFLRAAAADPSLIKARYRPVSLRICMRQRVRAEAPRSLFTDWWQ